MSKESSKEEVISKCKFVISPNARELTDDEIVQCIFGKSLKDFAKEIRENKDGKFDSLYI